jgi:adhesin transport system outer membrane protein
MRFASISAAIALAAFSFSAIAQTQPASLQAVVSAALLNHPMILGAQARREGAGYSLDAARNERFPSFSLGYGRANDGTHASSVALNQPIWTGGRITGGIAGSEYRLSASESGIREAELQLAEQVVSLALEVARYRALAEIANQNVITHEKLLSTTERRASAGAGTESDLVLAASRTDQARATLTQWQAAERRSSARLAILTGEAVPAQFVLGVPFNIAEIKVNTALLEAERFSPTVARLTAEASAAGSDVEVAESKLWPQLGLKAERLDNTGTLIQNDNRLLVTIEYQPGAGIGARDRAQAAGAQQRSAELSIDRSKRELAERVSADVIEAQGLTPRIDALERSVKANEQLVASFLRQFTAGKRSWLDVLNTQNDFASSSQALTDTRFTALAASYRVALATGRFFAVNAPAITQQAGQITKGAE